MPTHLFVLNNFRTWRVDETKVDQVVAMLDSLALPEPGRVPAEPLGVKCHLSYRVK